MRHPIIIIQGFGAPTFTNLPIKARLNRDGFAAHDAALPGFNVTRIEESSAVVNEKVAEVMSHGHHQVDMIGVSMGGLIGLHYLRAHKGDRHVRKFITLGTPFYGTPAAKLAGLLYGRRAEAASQMTEDSDFMRDLHKNDGEDKCEIISILARGDAMVPERSAALKGARLVKVKGTWPVGHYAPIIDPRNYQVLKKLLLE